MTELSSKNERELTPLPTDLKLWHGSSRNCQYYGYCTLKRPFSAYGCLENCFGFVMMEESEMNFIATPSTTPSTAFHDHAIDGPTSVHIYTMNSTTPANFLPPISQLAHLVLASVFTVLYAVLFLLILAQLYLILYFKHRRLSYQSVFLFIYLFWAALRTTLFAFYFDDTSTLQENSQKNIGSFARWLLFALPIYLQFLTLSLLTLYLAKVGTENISLN